MGTGHRWCPSCPPALAEEAALERCRTLQWASRRLARGEDRRSFRQGRGARAQGCWLIHFLCGGHLSHRTGGISLALSAEPAPAEDGAATLLALAAKGMAFTTSSRRRPSSDCLRAGEHDARGSHRRSADRDRVPTHAMGWSADLWRRRPSPISRAPGQEAALELPGTTSVRQPVTGARPAPLALRPLILSSSSCPTACGDRRRSPP